MKRWIYAAPVLAFAAIAFFLFKSLTGRPPEVLPSALIDKPVPQDTVPALDAQTQGFGPSDFTKGKVIIVNFFSSTCIPCRAEAPVLNDLSKMPGITLYGFVWKDKPENARAFLNEVGNPFSRIGLDTAGPLGIDWGVNGWPETFVIDGHGIIRFKYDLGPLTPEIVRARLLPAIEQARQAS